MIVGVIHGRTLAEAIEQQQQFADLVDMFEIRLDLMRELNLDDDLSPIFGKAPRPTIATCRHESEGGKFEGSETDRQDWLQMAIAAGAAWVDLELVAEFDLVPGDTKMVRSVHQFSGPTPSIESMISLAKHAESLGADAFKFAFRANGISDVLLVREVCERSPVPSIGIAMGPLGVPSRIAYRALGSEWTYGPLPDADIVAPGQVDVRLLRQRYRASELHADTRFFGVLGNPVAHSRGVRMHNAAFRLNPDLDACYLPLLAENIDDFWKFARGLPLAGFSVTTPFKTAVMAGLDAVDPAAQPLGAVNTVVRDANGQFRGTNTDLPGAFAALDAMRGDGESWAGKNVLLLGAGGSARVIVAGMLAREANVWIFNRTRERAAALAAAFENRPRVAESLADVAGVEFFAIVNSTTAGMSPNIDARPLDLATATAQGLSFADHALAFDLIYTPAPTRFLRDADALGLRTLDGRAMYRRQAELQFELWHDGEKLPAETDLDEI